MPLPHAPWRPGTCSSPALRVHIAHSLELSLHPFALPRPLLCSTVMEASSALPFASLSEISSPDCEISHLQVLRKHGKLIRPFPPPWADLPYHDCNETILKTLPPEGNPQLLAVVSRVLLHLLACTRSSSNMINRAYRRYSELSERVAQLTPTEQALCLASLSAGPFADPAHPNKRPRWPLLPSFSPAENITSNHPDTVETPLLYRINFRAAIRVSYGLYIRHTYTWHRVKVVIDAQSLLYLKYYYSHYY